MAEVTGKRKRTVEESFYAWWKRNNPSGYMSADDCDRIQTWARIAWANGYRLGQRRERQKRA